MFDLSTLVYSLLFLLFCVLLLLFTFMKSDGDLSLMFWSRFGKQPESLAGKVVWITGASSGIGEFIAYGLAKVGCRLVLSSRRLEELERVKKTCISLGKISSDDILVMALDMVKFDTHKDAVSKAIRQFGQIDILVNNAGRGQRALWEDVDLEVDQQLWDVNVRGTVSLTDQVLPHMLQQGRGHIVIMSSLAGKIGAPASRSYTGTKHALHGYFECMRMEMGLKKIDVTMICPGPVFSNLFTTAATGTPGENLGRTMSPTDKRLSTERCAYLSCIAIANKMYEVWISLPPILLFPYANQYFPTFAKWLSIRIGLKQVMKMREGQ